MSLNWNATNLPNLPWDEQTPEQSNLTANMAWNCMAVGLGVITESNWREFYGRYVFWCKLNDEPDTLTPRQVWERIGYSTNVTTETTDKWLRRISMHHIKDAMNHAEEDALDFAV